MERLPTWSECQAELESGSDVSALAVFIHDNEPSGDKAADEFRSSLLALIREIQGAS